MNIQLFPIGLLIRDTRYWMHPGKRQPTKDYVRNYKLFMQNEPNLSENQVNARSVLTKGYEADIVFWPKNPKANLLDAQMNVNKVLTKAYENKRNWTLGENEPKTNPKRTQLKPIQTQSNPKNTRFSLTYSA